MVHPSALPALWLQGQGHVDQVPFPFMPSEESKLGMRPKQSQSESFHVISMGGHCFSSELLTVRKWPWVATSLFPATWRKAADGRT